MLFIRITVFDYQMVGIISDIHYIGGKLLTDSITIQIQYFYDTVLNYNWFRYGYNAQKFELRNTRFFIPGGNCFIKIGVLHWRSVVHRYAGNRLLPEALIIRNEDLIVDLVDRHSHGFFCIKRLICLNHPFTAFISCGKQRRITDRYIFRITFKTHCRKNGTERCALITRQDVPKLVIGEFYGVIGKTIRLHRCHIGSIFMIKLCGFKCIVVFFDMVNRCGQILVFYFRRFKAYLYVRSFLWLKLVAVFIRNHNIKGVGYRYIDIIITYLLHCSFHSFKVFFYSGHK